MADNISITAGSGTVAATDDIGGVHYQRVKVTWGADGTATDTSVAAPLPTVQTGALPAGTNNIGDVDVLSLPATPAGSNIIGRVGIDQTTDGTTNLVAAKQSGTWTISTVTPGTAATNLGKAIDSVAGSTDTGVALLATRLDTLATLTPASGDYASPRVNARGALWAALDPNFAAVGGFTAVKDITLTTDTSAYSAGDLIAETQVVSGAARVTNGTGQIFHLMVRDEANQRAQFTVYFLSANNTMGTENALPSISAANSAAIRGLVRVEASDYSALGGASVASINCAIPLVVASGTSDIYVAVVNGAGAPTYGATSLKISLGIQQD